MTDTTDVTIDEHGNETHPAFGLIGAHRISIAGGQHNGTTLFDSDFVHQNAVRISIKAATRRRDLHRDWIHGGKEYIEIEMSEAQWASFVSTMNVGDGVPCTLRRLDGQRIPKVPYAPRLAASIDEARQAADLAFTAIAEAMAAYDALDPKAPAKQRRGALNNLRSAIANASDNVAYAAKSLGEHAENVVTKARADIEAYVVAKAGQLGIEVPELGSAGLPGAAELESSED